MALVGSQATGWRHALSDLDLLVVTDAPIEASSVDHQVVALTHPTIAVASWVVDDMRCEAKCWSQGQVVEALAKVSWELWDAGASGGSLTLIERQLFERVPPARALVGHKWLASTADLVRGSAAHSVLALTSLTKADGQLEDVTGLWRSGDLRSAVLAAQQAFLLVTDALTASLGHPGSDTKWRPRRVEAVGSETLGPDEFWRIATMQDLDPAAPERWLDYVTFTCSRIMLDVKLGRPPATATAE